MAKSKSDYSQKLKDPRWQKLRLAVLERDEWACVRCGATDKNLQVHHGFYQFRTEPWDYQIESLHTCCEECHKWAEMCRKYMLERFGCLALEQQDLLSGMMQSLALLPDRDRDDLIHGISDLAKEVCKEKFCMDGKSRLAIVEV